MFNVNDLVQTVGKFQGIFLGAQTIKAQYLAFYNMDVDTVGCPFRKWTQKCGIGIHSYSGFYSQSGSCSLSSFTHRKINPFLFRLLSPIISCSFLTFIHMKINPFLFRFLFLIRYVPSQYLHMWKWTLQYSRSVLGNCLNIWESELPLATGQSRWSSW